MVKGKSRQSRQSLEQRVEAFRALVYRGVEKASRRGHDFMPYEGAMSLSWPPFVHMRSGRGRYSLHLSCSVFGGPSNHYAWRGRSWGEAFRKATADVEFWISQINGDTK